MGRVTARLPGALQLPPAWTSSSRTSSWQKLDLCVKLHPKRSSTLDSRLAPGLQQRGKTYWERVNTDGPYARLQIPTSPGISLADVCSVFVHSVGSTQSA